MKLMLGNVPVKSLNINKFEMDTNDATITASDMQQGMTAYARGGKVVGTGKAFNFASYGKYETNSLVPVPNTINLIGISSLAYPIQTLISLNEMKETDFTSEKTVANVVISEKTYPIQVSVSDGQLKIACSQAISLQVFYGKDDHII